MQYPAELRLLVYEVWNRIVEIEDADESVLAHIARGPKFILE